MKFFRFGREPLLEEKSEFLVGGLEHEWIIFHFIYGYILDVILPN